MRVDDGSVTMAPNPHGPQMPWVDVLTIDRVVGDRIGALFSYAAHPVVVHGASTKISADFPGFAMKYLYDMATAKRVFLFAQGCSGNINGFPLRGGIGAADACGRDLAHAVARAIKGGGGELKSQRLNAAALNIDLPMQNPPPVAKCREMAAKSPDDERLQELLAIAEKGEPQVMPFPMRAFAIGDELCILSMPHEMFSQYQLYAEKISPFPNNIVLAYTNGCECYVGMKEHYQQGPGSGYETSPMGASLLYHRRVGLVPEAEDIIKAGIKEILQKVSAA